MRGLIRTLAIFFYTMCAPMAQSTTLLPSNRAAPRRKQIALKLCVVAQHTSANSPHQTRRKQITSKLCVVAHHLSHVPKGTITMTIRHTTTNLPHYHSTHYAQRPVPKGQNFMHIKHTVTYTHTRHDANKSPQNPASWHTTSHMCPKVQ